MKSIVFFSFLRKASWIYTNTRPPSKQQRLRSAVRRAQRAAYPFILLHLIPRVVFQEERLGQFLQVSLEQPVICYNIYLAFYTVFLVKGALGIQSETLLTDGLLPSMEDCSSIRAVGPLNVTTAPQSFWQPKKYYYPY